MSVKLKKEIWRGSWAECGCLGKMRCRDALKTGKKMCMKKVLCKDCPVDKLQVVVVPADEYDTLKRECDDFKKRVKIFASQRMGRINR